jgi:abortive infection bacteriophage resistance protein
MKFFVGIEAVKNKFEKKHSKKLKREKNKAYGEKLKDLGAEEKALIITPPTSVLNSTQTKSSLTRKRVHNFNKVSKFFTVTTKKVRKKKSKLSNYAHVKVNDSSREINLASE